MPAGGETGRVSISRTEGSSWTKGTCTGFLTSSTLGFRWSLENFAYMVSKEVDTFRKSPPSVPFFSGVVGRLTLSEMRFDNIL